MGIQCVSLITITVKVIKINQKNNQIRQTILRYIQYFFQCLQNSVRQEKKCGFCEEEKANRKLLRDGLSVATTEEPDWLDCERTLTKIFRFGNVRII